MRRKEKKNVVAIAKERENECLAIERQRYNKGTAKC
jgi:hypothetical protein